MIKLDIWIDWNSNNECLQSDCNYYRQHYKYTIENYCLSVMYSKIIIVVCFFFNYDQYIVYIYI